MWHGEVKYVFHRDITSRLIRLIADVAHPKGDLECSRSRVQLAPWPSQTSKTVAAKKSCACGSPFQVLFCLFCFGAAGKTICAALVFSQGHVDGFASNCILHGCAFSWRTLLHACREKLASPEVMFLKRSPMKHFEQLCVFEIEKVASNHSSIAKRCKKYFERRTMGASWRSCWLTFLLFGCLASSLAGEQTFQFQS